MIHAKQSLEDELGRRGVRLKRISRREWAGPCPKCGGEDRFAINIEKQVWNCRGCHKGGDVITLVQHLDGVGFGRAIEILTGERLHEAPIKISASAIAEEIHKLTEDEQRNTATAREWFGEASDPRGTPVEQYLASRSLKLDNGIATGVIRFHPCVPWGDGKVPALLAAFRSIDSDEIVAVQRMRLDERESWPKIERKMFGPVRRAAIKLDAKTSELTISEGVENGLAGRRYGYTPAWALGSAGAVERFPVIDGVRLLRVQVERCAASLRAVGAVRLRWLQAGRVVRIIYPPDGCKDLNDALMRANVS